jgi:predicted Zn-dependent protease
MTTLKPWPNLTNREEFRFLSDLVFKRSSGEHTVVSLHDQHGGTTRFANNQVVQNVDTRRGMLTVTVAFGHKKGTASTTDFTAGAVQETVVRAERHARVSPDDPEYLPPPNQQAFLSLPTVRAESRGAGPARRLEYAGEAIGQCRMENLSAAGIVASSVEAAGIAADTGLFAYEERTEARFSVTVQHGDATGWASATHRSIDHLKVQDRTLSAITKAKHGVEPRELDPGPYDVILEPSAAAGLWTWILWNLDAKAHDKGTSPFSGKLGQAVVDPRISLENISAHEDLMGIGFTAEGLATGPSRWIEQGTLKQLSFDRYTAKIHHLDQLPTLDAPCVSVAGATAHSVQELVKAAPRALLITNFWYIRPVNPSDLTLTGMTRDGTFLVEGGHIVSAVKNLRFHDSPLRAFKRVGACTVPLEAVSSETGKMLVPAMTLRDFNFSSVTRF